MARKSFSRSVSSSSTLSCIRVRNQQCSSISPTSCLTDPTSVTDLGSEAPLNADRAEHISGNIESTQQPRSRVGTHDEAILSRRVTRTSGSGSKCDSPKIASSSESLDGQRSQRNHELQIIQTPSLCCATGTPLTKHRDESEGYSAVPLLSRKATRHKTTTDLNWRRTAHGSERRGMAKVEKERPHFRNRRTTLWPRVQDLTDSGMIDPQATGCLSFVKKKPKGTQPRSDGQRLAPQNRHDYRPKTKVWLSQGLYIGQDRNFDARLTETKNKLKHNGEVADRQRSILPMPMFAGHRTLEMGRDFRLPFNVFSPLPPGQPKPEEWKRTRKNVFIGEAADNWKSSKRPERSICVCKPESGCDEGCFNRFMFYECDDENCGIGAEFCTNRSFAALRQRCRIGGKYNIGVELIKTIDRGYGVRSNRTFEPNQIIVEYTGEIITPDECDYRMRHIYKNNECFYLMVFDQNMICDATRGSIARFVNHSCEPNCKMIKWTVEGKPRMALFAGECGIMTGNELTYDYNFDPFSSKNTQECRCGAASCRGVLGPRPKTKEIRDILQPPLPTNGKRKRQGSPGIIPEVVPSKRQRPTAAFPIDSTTRNLRQPVSDMARSTTRARNPVWKCLPSILKGRDRQQESLIIRTRNQNPAGTGHTIRWSSSKVSVRQNTTRADRPLRRGVLQSTADTVKGKVDWKW